MKILGSTGELMHASNAGSLADFCHAVYGKRSMRSLVQRVEVHMHAFAATVCSRGRAGI